jgi:transcriptional regulator with XRE-family HTH domain
VKEIGGMSAMKLIKKNDYAETLGEKLRTLRISLKMNQTKACQRIGCTLATLSRYENGIRVPDLQMLERIAVAYQTSSGYITDGIDYIQYAPPEIEKIDKEVLSELIFEIVDAPNAVLEKTLNYVQFLKKEKRRNRNEQI